MNGDEGMKAREREGRTEHRHIPGQSAPRDDRFLRPPSLPDACDPHYLLNAWNLRRCVAVKSWDESESRGAMAELKNGAVRVQIAGAKPQDVGTGTARVSRRAMQVLGMREGDVLEIVGKRTTVARAEG